MGAAQYCGIIGRDEFSKGQSVEDWLSKDDGQSLFPLPPGALQNRAEELLKNLMDIERIIRSETVDALAVDEDATANFGDMSIELVLDEPGIRYCMCHPNSSDISDVTGCLWILLPEVELSDAVTALADREERRKWDCDFDILSTTSTGDNEIREEVTFHTLRAPWPFWDRDVLQKRWQIELPQKEGYAFLMQSFVDPILCPIKEDRIRAHVNMGGYLLRPMQQATTKEPATGIEMTVCSSLQLGGNVPEWAQSMLCKFAARRGASWAEKLQAHCQSVQARRNGYESDYETDDEPDLHEFALMGM